jgi:hypothetical protein
MLHPLIPVLLRLFDLDMIPLSVALLVTLRPTDEFDFATLDRYQADLTNGRTPWSPQLDYLTAETHFVTRHVRHLVDRYDDPGICFTASSVSNTASVITWQSTTLSPSRRPTAALL